MTDRAHSVPSALIAACVLLFLVACQPAPETPERKVTQPVEIPDKLSKDSISDNVIYTDSDSLYNDEDLPGKLTYAGIFHFDELNENEWLLSNWLGLQKNGKKLALVPIKLKLTRVFDPVLDEDTLNPTGWKLDVEQDSIFFLLAGNALRESNQLPLIYWGEPLELYPGQTFEFTFNNASYRLLAFGEQQMEEEYALIKNYELYLERKKGGEKQTVLITQHAAFDEAMTSVWLISDLNADGAPDLILDNSADYNAFVPTLFLSSIIENKISYICYAKQVSVGC